MTKNKGTGEFGLTSRIFQCVLVSFAGSQPRHGMSMINEDRPTCRWCGSRSNTTKLSSVAFTWKR
jgi:hypothetical protein